MSEEEILYPVQSLHVALALFLSFIVVIIITSVISRILRRSSTGYGLIDIIRDGDGWPSLARFQFFFWTIIITFSFLTVYLVRIMGGFLEPIGEIPQNILMLMGISVSVPIASNYLSNIKYGVTTGESPTPDPKKDREEKRFASMLMEAGRPSLSRFQMLSWTLIGILIYLLILWNRVFSPEVLKDTSILILPNIDPTLIVLMGISQGVYIGGKIMTTTSLEIAQIRPKEGKKDTPVTLIGYDFGTDKDIVFFGDVKLKGDLIDNWNFSTIEFKVPVDEEGKYDIIVKVGSRTTKPKKFKVIK